MQLVLKDWPPYRDEFLLLKKFRLRNPPGYSGWYDSFDRFVYGTIVEISYGRGTTLNFNITPQQSPKHNG